METTAWPHKMTIISNKDRKLKFLLFVAVILASALRIYRLSYQSLWLDEVLNANWSGLPSVSRIIQFLSTNDNSPPLYYLFLHFWMKLGSGEFMLRLPSAIAGVIAVFIIFRISETLFDRNTGLIAAFLAGASPFYLWVSQEARMYAFLSMFSLFSFYFFIRAIKENKIKLWLGYVIFSLLALYTHYYAIFTIFAEAVYFTFNVKNFKQLIKNYIFSTVTMGILFMPCLFFIVQQFSVSTRRHAGLFPSTIWALPHAFFDFSTGYSLLQIELSNFSRNIFYNLTVIILSGVIFITIFISGLFYIIHRKKDVKLILFYLFIPIIVSFIISLKVHIFGSKYLVAPAGAYFLILACGLKNLRPKGVLAIFILCFLIITGLSIANYYLNDNFAKGGFREAAKFIENNEKTGDVILFPQPEPALAFQYYYRGRIPAQGAISNDGKLSENMEIVLKASKRAWFMPDLQKLFDPDNLTKKRLSSQEKSEKEYRFKSVTVISYILK